VTVAHVVAVVWQLPFPWWWLAGIAGFIAITEKKSLKSPELPTLGVAQSRVFQSVARFVVLVAGRRFGKTTLAAVRLFRKAYMKKASLNWYLAPTYRQAKNVLWQPLKSIIPRMYVLKINESELSITLKNYSVIALKGADNPDSLRGSGLDHVEFDEFATMKLAAYTESIRAALSDKPGTASFIGSPAGFNHLYDYFNRGTTKRFELDNRGRAPWRNWEGFLFTTLQGGRVPVDEIEAAKEELDPRVFRQEYLASFVTLAGQVYDNFSRLNWPYGNIDPTIQDHGRELYVGMDFNINPMSAVVCQSIFGQCEVLVAIQLMTSNTQNMAQHLKELFPGRRLIICPDASGNQRRSSAALGETDLTILESHGFEILTERSNPHPPDRINNVQSNLLSGSLHRTTRIHPSCVHLIKGLEGLTWKEGTRIVDKKTGLDHICDAFGYVQWQVFNVLAKHIPAVAPAESAMEGPFPGE
jgi:hypothetical protein